MGKLLRRLSYFLFRARHEAELLEEIEEHRALRQWQLERNGAMPSDAARTSRRLLGNVTMASEDVREVWIGSLDSWWQDARHGTRALLKTPSFTAVAIATLALGIGVNTAIFSVVDAAILRPLPYASPDRLVSIWEAAIGNGPSSVNTGGMRIGADDPGRMAVAPANLVDYETRAYGFTGMAGVARSSLTLTGAGVPEQLIGEEVTSKYFDLLGARPASGRVLVEADGRIGGAPVVIISDALWRDRFGADPLIVGRSISLNDQRHEVIGIMPAGFTAVSQLGRTDAVTFWVPAVYSADVLANHSAHEINVIARLLPDTTIASAQQSLAVVSEQLARDCPQSNDHLRAFARPLQDDLFRVVRPSLIGLMLMVSLVLLMACVNVANLLIVRGLGQQREVAVRFALGASRGRVVTAMLAQSLLLSVTACFVGLLLGYWTRNALMSLAPANVPRPDAVLLDARILAFTACLGIGTGLLFGSLPAWQVRLARPIDVLKATERSGASAWMLRWRNALMVVQVALATMLLVGAALAWKSLVTVNSVEIGFRTDHILALNVSLPDRRYKTGEDRYRFFSRLEEQIARIPGVRRAAYANRLPLLGGWRGSMMIDGVALPNGYADLDLQAVSPGYFETFGLRLTRGRLLTAADTNKSQPVAVVSERLSSQFLHGANPIGVRMRHSTTAPWITIVGVTADIRRGGKRAGVTPEAYLAAAQTSLYPVRLADIAVLAWGDPTLLSNPIRDAVWSVDKDQPIASVQTLEDVLGIRAKDQSFQTTLFASFAGLALILALVGIYAVVSYAIAQRTHEISVRVALGADGRRILVWLMGEASVLVALGAMLGLAGSLGLSRYLTSLLFQVKPTDPATYLAVGIGLPLVALVASFLAARRATLIDAVGALRQG